MLVQLSPAIHPIQPIGVHSLSRCHNQNVHKSAVRQSHGLGTLPAVVQDDLLRILKHESDAHSQLSYVSSGGLVPTKDRSGIRRLMRNVAFKVHRPTACGTSTHC